MFLKIIILLESLEKNAGKQSLKVKLLGVGNGFA